jgi:hypothetical protein
MKKVLQHIMDQHSELAARMNYSYYWEVDGHKLYNLNLARWYEKEYNAYARFVCSPDYMQRFQQALSDKHVDMNHNYDLDMIRKLKKDYSHVSLLFSGGYDSSRVFFEFVENGIMLDETIMHLYPPVYEKFNKEFRMNGIGALEAYKHMVGKNTVVQATDDDLVNQFNSDEYLFFNAPMEALYMPWEMGYYSPERHFKELSVQKRGPSETPPHLEFKQNSCHIKAIDKPQLIYYKRKWYVTASDANIGDRNGLMNTIFFWLHPDNVKSLIQQARKFRDFCLTSNDGIKRHAYASHIREHHNPNFDPKSPLSFFTLNDNSEWNYIIGSDRIYHPESKLPKHLGVPGRRIEAVDKNRFDIVCAYAKCMGKFLEIFPECGKGLRDYNNQGKFAWIIDIDTLEIFTQEELIPNGFEGVDTLRKTAMPNDEMRKLSKDIS